MDSRKIPSEFSTDFIVSKIRDAAAENENKMQEFTARLEAKNTPQEIMQMDFNEQSDPEFPKPSLIADKVRLQINNLIYATIPTIPVAEFDEWFNLWNSKFSEKIATIVTEEEANVAALWAKLQDFLSLAQKNKGFVEQVGDLLRSIFQELKPAKKREAKAPLQEVLHILDGFAYFYENFRICSEMLLKNNLRDVYQILTFLEVLYATQPDLVAVDKKLTENYQLIPALKDKFKANVRKQIDTMQSFVVKFCRVYEVEFQGNFSKYGALFEVNTTTPEAHPLPELIQINSKKIADILEKEKKAAMSKLIFPAAKNSVETYICRNLFLYLTIQLTVINDEHLKLVANANYLTADLKPRLLNNTARKIALQAAMFMRSGSLAIQTLHEAINTCEHKKSLCDSLQTALKTQIETPDQKPTHEEILLKDKRRARLLEGLRRHEEKEKRAAAAEALRLQTEKQQQKEATRRAFTEQRDQLLEKIAMLKKDEYQLIMDILIKKPFPIKEADLVVLAVDLGMQHSTNKKGGTLSLNQSSFSFFSKKIITTKDFKQFLEDAGITSKNIPLRIARNFNGGSP